MGSEFHISRHLGGGYIISEALLRKCMQLVETFSWEGAPPEISVTFRDGRTVNSEDPDDVFSDSFIQSSRISEITISSYHHTSLGASITFRKHGEIPSYFRVTGGRSASLVFERDLINELAASKQWYSSIASLRPIILVATLVIVGLFISTITFFSSWPPDFYVKTITYPIFSLLSLIFLLRIIAFPPIIFDLGDGARRQKVRTTIWSFIIVTVIAGILVSIFTDWIKGWLSGSHS